LLIVLVLVVAVVGLGFYRGWFHVSSVRADDKPNVTFSADPVKIQDDKKTALEKVHNLGGQVKDKAAVPTDEKDKDKIATPVQPPQN
jgi:hypothetical protein